MGLYNNMTVDEFIKFMIDIIKTKKYDNHVTYTIHQLISEHFTQDDINMVIKTIEDNVAIIDASVYVEKGDFKIIKITYQ